MLIGLFGRRLWYSHHKPDDLKRRERIETVPTWSIAERRAFGTTNLLGMTLSNGVIKRDLKRELSHNVAFLLEG